MSNTRLVKTRVSRLFIATVLAVLLCLMALFALPWVRDSSGSLLVDSVVILAWLALVIAASWAQVAATLAPGRPGVSSAGEEPEGVVRASFNRNVMVRAALVFVALAANFTWSNLAAGNFWFGHYSAIGAISTAMRSDSSETRKWAISRVAEMSSPSLSRMIDPLASLTNDDDPDVRANAVAALGHIARRMRVSVAMLEREGAVASRWEPAVLASLRVRVSGAVRSVRSERGPVRRAWIAVLGGLGDRESVPVLRAVIDDAGTPAGDVVAAVDALADISGPSTLDALRQALTNTDPEVQRHAAWAIAMVTADMVATDSRAAESSVEFTKTEEEMAARLPGLDIRAACAYLRLFPKVGDARMTRALVEMGRSGRFDARCDRAERTRWFGTPEVITAEGNLGSLVLDAMAAVAVGNRELRAFLAEAISRGTYDPSTKARMRDILERMGQ